MRFRPPPPSHVSGLLSPSWRTSLTVVCVAQASAMLAFGFVLPFLPLYLKEIGVSPDSAVVFWSGALVTSTGISLAIFSPIWGALADRHGRKLMVLRSMLIGGLIIALMGLVQNVEQFRAAHPAGGVHRHDRGGHRPGCGHRPARAPRLEHGIAADQRVRGDLG